jgi:capsule polysaccharide export protein KpsE/RkpR
VLTVEPIQGAATVEMVGEDENYAPVSTHFAVNIRLLIRARRLIFRVVIVGAIATLLISFLIHNRYRSTVELMPPDNQSGSGLAALATLAGSQGGMLGNLAGELRPNGNAALFVAVLHSRTMQDEIVTQFNLRQVYGVKRMEAARRILSENTEVAEDRRSGVISVNVTDRSAPRAAAIAQAYSHELDVLVATLNTSAARRERMFLEERLKTVSSDLEKSSTDLAQFSSKNGIFNIPDQAKATVAAAATLEGELIATEAELRGLQQIYTDKNPRVRSLAAHVAELRSKAAAISGKESDNGNSGLDFPSMRELPILGVRYADLYRHAMVQEKVFEHLTTEYELAKVEEAKETPTVRVLDSAEVPELKAGPNRLLILVFGIMVSFASSVLWVVERARWRLLPEQHVLKVVATEIQRSASPLMSRRYGLRRWSLHFPVSEPLSKEEHD